MLPGLRGRRTDSHWIRRRWLIVVALTAGAGAVLPMTVAEAGPGWTVSSSPNSGALNNQLNAISCPSKTMCMAVGSYNDVSNLQAHTLVELWNGTSWSVLASPNPGAFADDLTGVSCTSATWCMAVGHKSATISSVPTTLALRWNGAAWASPPTPNIGPNGNEPQGVSCVTPAFCMAVGGYFVGLPTTGNATQAMVWNGDRWQVSKTPNVANTNDGLNGVSCVRKPTLECFAVGQAYTSNGNDPVIESWVGGTWKLGSISGPHHYGNLEGVSCVSTSSCSAVGQLIASIKGTPVFQTLAVKWNGLKWSRVSSQSTAPSLSDQLLSVSCTSATSCTGSGYRQSGSVSKPLILATTGGTWKIASSPGPLSSVLFGTACVSTTACKVVGDSYGPPAYVEHSLVESHP